MKAERYISLTKALYPVDATLFKSFHTTFIVKKGKIQKIGINNYSKTHPRILKYKYTGKEGVDIRSFVGVHSELDAVMKYNKTDCADCIFINVRVDRNGRVAMAAPCTGCSCVLQQVGFKKVYYTTEDEQLVEWKP